MRVHHLNCGTHCPLGGALLDGHSHGPLARVVTHCLLVETGRGLVLVDTGYGLQDVLHPHPRISRLLRFGLNIRLHEHDTALRQVERLGFSAADVRHIVLTHLDFDHAGGVEDFPEARVHVLTAEREAATHMRDDFVGRRRYRPLQWDGVRDWRLYEAGGEPWFGFDAVRGLDGLPPEILMVPLPGHTLGHAGIAVQAGDRWLLHAGDAFFHQHELDPQPRCPAGAALYQRLLAADNDARRVNQARLRDLNRDHGATVSILCSHDTVMFEALASS